MQSITEGTMSSESIKVKFEFNSVIEANSYYLLWEIDIPEAF